MANLQAELQQLSIEFRLNKYYQSKYKERNYLGLSQVGHKCPAFLWYVYNKYPGVMPDGKLLRLFEHGNKVEEWIVSDLKKLGYRIKDSQKEVMFEHEGLKLFGHIDGIIEGLEESYKPHLLEIKSANEKKFNQLIKLNSYEEWNEQYKTQIQIYMLGLNLDRCLIVVYCKNDSRVYSERIKINKDFTIKKLQDVFSIISSPERPERKCPRADWYEAKWCDYKDECFG